VLVVGLAYKENTSELRESPALKALEGPRRKVAKISASDEEIPDGSWLSGVELVCDHELKDTTFDLAVVLTIHENARTHLENLRPRHCLVARNGWDTPFEVDVLSNRNHPAEMFQQRLCRQRYHFLLVPDLPISGRPRK